MKGRKRSTRHLKDVILPPLALSAVGVKMVADRHTHVAYHDKH